MMKTSTILLMSLACIASTYGIQASNAFNNDATYYLDQVDDLKPVGMHPQKDDLDVSVTQSPLIQAVLNNQIGKVRQLLKNTNFSDQDIADALYYAKIKNFTKIVKLLSTYENDLYNIS